MRKLKFYVSEKNYVQIRWNHIFINFAKHNLDFLDNIHPNSVRGIHVFITNHASINNSLKSMVQLYGNHRDGGPKNVKIVFHIPKPVSGMKELLDKFLDGVGSYKSYVENKDIVFFTDSNQLYLRYMLRFMYRDNVLHVDVSRNRSMIEIRFPSYPYNPKEENEGVFENEAQRLDPEKFQEQIISSFKKNTPNGILQSFKTDSEIMEYILQEGEWNTGGKI